MSAPLPPIEPAPVPPPHSESGVDPGPPEAGVLEMERRARRGSMWATIGFGAGNVLKFGSVLVTTRLLVPEAFGVMLVVEGVLIAVAQFSDVGIGAGVIQNRRSDAKYLNTAFTLQALRGVALGLVTLALGWPCALFFKEPSLALLIPFAGLSGLAWSLRSTNVFTANRELSLGRLTAIEFASQATSTAATIVWAFLDPSVWALAGGGVIGSTLGMVLTHTALPGLRNRFEIDREAARSLLNFGKGLFFSTLLGYLASEAHRIVFGRLLVDDKATAGVFNNALRIAIVPQQVLRRLALSVDFAQYAHVHRSGGDLPLVFRKARRRVLLLAAVACSAMLAGGGPFVELVYPNTYAGAGWMVQLLAFSLWWNTLEVTYEAALLARAETYKVAYASLVKVIVMAILIPIGVVAGGFAGGLAGFVASELVRYVAIALLARDAGLGGTRQELQLTALMLGIGGLGWLVAEVLHQPGVHVALRLTVLAVLVVGAWAPLALPMLRRGSSATAPPMPSATP